MRKQQRFVEMAMQIIPQILSNSPMCIEESFACQSDQDKRSTRIKLN